MAAQLSTVGQWLKQSRTLDAATSRLDVELLLGHVLGKERAFLRAWPEHRLSDEQSRQFAGLLARRQQGEPIAYLLGQREFWSLPLKLSPHTLIPRPETETLVAAALEHAVGDSLAVLDLGTGSGAVALALASERPRWRLHAVDIEAHCVSMAVLNASRNGLPNVSCWRSDWFAKIDGRYALIVANPPYIDAGDQHLEQGDLRFEPRRALVADRGGMGDIGRITAAAPAYLEPGGWLMLEHGYQQGEACRALFDGRGYVEIEGIADLAGRLRVTIARWPGE